jgi:hypothetical protein
VPRVGLARKGAKDFLHPLRLEQSGEAGVAVAGVVVDDGEIARALRDQRIDQRRRHPRVAEAADHHRGAVRYVGEGRFSAGEELVDHGAEIIALQCGKNILTFHFEFVL